MKKIFAFAMAVVSMAAVMTSCQQDDTMDFIQQPAPGKVVNNVKTVETKFDGNIYIAATADMLQYVNCTLTVTACGEINQFNINELPVSPTTPSVVKENIPSSLMPTLFVYKIPANTKGQVKVEASYSIKEGVELPETIDLASGSATAQTNDIHVMPGLNKVKVDSFLSRMNASPIFTMAL